MIDQIDTKRGLDLKSRDFPLASGCLMLELVMAREAHETILITDPQAFREASDFNIEMLARLMDSVFVIPGTLLALLGVHLWLVLKCGISATPDPNRPVVPETYLHDYEHELKTEGVPFLGDAMLKDIQEGKGDIGKMPVPVAAEYSNTRELGLILYTKYAYPFELAAVLLLVAIVAAIALTMRRRPGLKVQDVNLQVATRSQDRIRIIKMDAEKRP